MVTFGIFDLSKAQDSPFMNKLVVARVDGSKENPAYRMPQVSSSSFRQAWGLSIAEVFGSRPPKKRLHYEIITESRNMQQPSLGFDMTVMCSVHDKIVEKLTQRAVFDDLI